MNAALYRQYFSAQAELGKAFIHPGGKDATLRLLRNIMPLPDRPRVLELGCGPGETAALLLQRCNCTYVGIDASMAMLSRSRNRLGEFGQRATLIQSDIIRQSIPFADCSFDAVIAESVMGMLTPELILRECFRVLRPSGKMGWNDRIWGEKIDPEIRIRINAACEESFGLFAAPEYPGTFSEWNELLHNVGFNPGTHEQLFLSQNDDTMKRMHDPGRWKKALTLLRNPSLYRYLRADRTLYAMFENIWTKMENWIFVASKP